MNLDHLKNVTITSHTKVRDLTDYDSSKFTPLESVVGKIVGAVGSGHAEGEYGDEPVTVIFFTDGTYHAFTHPAEDQ